MRKSETSVFPVRSRFTLIELLIILAVIAVQAQLLLPALKRAKGRARVTSCSDNLKKIGAAHQSYISDYAGWLIPVSVQKYQTPGHNFHYYSMQWFGMLSGYTIKGYKQIIPGYGLKYGGISDREKSPDFDCPAEPMDFGPYDQNLFAYTHFAINGYLVGSNNQRKWVQSFNRKTNCLTDPSKALIFADNRNLSNASMYPSVDSLAFRHGAADPREYNGKEVEPAAVTTGKCNMIFMDNHVEAADYRTVMTWKPDKPVPRCYTSNYHMFLRGFDAFK